MQQSSLKQKIKSLLITLWRSTRQVVTSGQLRRYRAVLFQAYVLAALLSFAVLALVASLLTASNVPYLAFDLDITRELQEDIPPVFGIVLQAVSWPGYGVNSVVMIAIVVLVLFFLGVRWEAAAVLFAAVSSGLLNYLVKVTIRRPRPSEDLVDVLHALDSFSFPSGHVMFYTAFFGFLLFLTFILLKNSWRRSLLMFLLTAMIALVGVSRMYLGEHWASDVIGGYLLGSLTLILVIQFYRQGKARFFTDQPVAPTETADQAASKVEPHLTLLGESKNAHDPDRAGTPSSTRGDAETNTVPQTGRPPDRHGKTRGDRKAPPRD